MKKIILLTIWFVFFAWSYGLAGDVDTIVTVNPYFLDTLTATIDTIDVAFMNPQRFSCFTITVKSSANDTITVWTPSRDGSLWVQHALVDLSTNLDVASIPATTTQKEYLILDPQPQKIRVISLSDDSSTCIISVAGKKVY